MNFWQDFYPQYEFFSIALDNFCRICIFRDESIIVYFLINNRLYIGRKLFYEWFVKSL